MMLPRITINRSKKGEIEIWLNEAGRDRLVRALLMLSETDDHIHLGPADIEVTELPLRSIPYRESDEVLDWGKILFRTDAWDAKYFPHVLADEGDSS